MRDIEHPNEVANLATSVVDSFSLSHVLTRSMVSLSTARHLLAIIKHEFTAIRSHDRRMLALSPVRLPLMWSMLSVYVISEK